jgi:hypothetical protein
MLYVYIAVPVFVVLVLLVVVPVTVCCCYWRRHQRPRKINEANKTLTNSEGVRSTPQGASRMTSDSQTEGSHNFERAGTVHYYDYIQSQDAETKPQNRPPAPLPLAELMNADEADHNMTANVSYDSSPYRPDPNERYTLPRPPLTQPSQLTGSGGGRGHQIEGEEYIRMVSDQAHAANSDQETVIYI